MFHHPRLYAFADEASPMIDGQIAALLRNRLDGLEIRNVDGESVSRISPDKAREVREKLDGSGLVCWSVGSPIGKIGITYDFATHLDELRHTLDIADILGAENIRMFSFYLPSGSDPALFRGQVMDRLARMAEIAEGRARLCHENEKGIYGDSPDRCLDILRTVPDLDGVFDPANFVQCGYRPGKAFPLLQSRIRYLHIKDALFADGSVVPAGYGDGSLADVVSAFTRRDRPVMTVEPHLTVFAGLDALEQGAAKSRPVRFVYESSDAAFDAACGALRALLDRAEKASGSREDEE